MDIATVKQQSPTLSAAIRASSALTLARLSSPILNHALQGLSIEVVSDVKVAQHVQREGAHVNQVLMDMECPDMPHVKHLLHVQWGVPELPAEFTSYSKRTSYGAGDVGSTPGKHCGLPSHHLCKT